MKTRALTVIASTLAIASLAATAGQAVNLKRIPKVGDKSSYLMKIDLVYEGMDINVTFDSIHTITKVNDDGSFVATEESKDQVILVGGQEMPGGENEVSTMTYAANGSLTKIESSAMMGDEYRLANLTVLLWPTKPVDVGSKWESKTPADKAKSTFDTEYSFEILAREKLMDRDCFKISFSAKETNGGEASNTGIMWIEVKNGNTVKATGEMKQVPIQGMPMDAKFVLEMKK